MRSVLLLLLLFTASLSFAQSNDAALNQRLAEYAAANQRLDFEAVMDYIYPKLFKMASREAVIESFEKAFNNEEIQIKLDSMAITKVGPVFAHGLTAYRKVDYTMTMGVTFTDKEKLSDTAFVKLVETSFAKVFRGTAVYNKATESFHVRGQQFMLAIKDKGQPWTFIGHKPDKALNEFLFPQAFINKFALLKE